MNTKDSTGKKQLPEDKSSNESVTQLLSDIIRPLTSISPEHPPPDAFVCVV